MPRTALTSPTLFTSRLARRQKMMAAAVMLPAVLLTGCTSVTRTSLAQAGSADGTAGAVDGGTQGGTPGDPTTTGGQISGGSSTSGTSVGGTGAGSATGGSTGGNTGGGSAGGGTTAGSGTTGGRAASTCRTPIKIGVSHSSDNGKAAGAFGATGGVDQEGLDAYDNANKKGNTTMVSWVNANGGFAGCPGVVSFYDYKMLNSDGHPAETQRECTAFAQDQKVNIVYNNMSESGGLIPCLAKHGIVNFFDGINYTPSPADFRKYQGFLYQSRAITPYRWRPFVPLLSKYGYFAADAQGNKTSQPPVGILLSDTGDGHNDYLVNKLWVPELNKLGIKSVVYRFNPNADPAAMSSAFNAAIVQFKQNNVKHVMMTPDGAAATIFFTPAAEGQQYRPRYALTTANSAPSFTLLTQPGQRNNSMIVSIDPHFDVVANDVPGGGDLSQFYSNGRSANATLCAQIFKGRVPARSTIESMYPICDRYLELRMALAGQTKFSKETLLAGMNGLGAGYVPTIGYGPRKFSAPNHYDGYQAVRVAQWQPSNSSFIYKSPKIPIPIVGG